MSSIHVFPPKRILVPTDMGPASEAALRYAEYFHKRFKSEVLVLHAHHFELPPYFSSSQMADLRRKLKQATAAAREYVRQHSESVLGFSPDVRIVESPPTDAILEASSSENIDMILMGMHGHHGIERIWMGSVTEQVIRRGSIPVLAVRSAPSETPIRRILCPVNPSDTGKQALQYSAEVSKALQARLIVLYVVEQGAEPLPCPLVDDPMKADCQLEEINLKGNAAKTIADASKDLNPDLIILGSERKSSVLGEFFSSTTSSVMQMARGPLLIVPKR
jgi:nucleotide-binding universal stress UspA family protein